MRLTRFFCQAWGVGPLASTFKVAYNPRLRTTLGRAFLEEGRVELNTRLLREHPDHLLPTLAHELAHLVVYRIAGRKAPPHGRAFRALMRQLNLPEGATHNLPVGKLKRPRKKCLYLHRCRGCGATFIARKVRRDIGYCAACGIVSRASFEYKKVFFGEQ